MIVLVLRVLGEAYFLLPTPLRRGMTRAMGWLLSRFGPRAAVVRQNLAYAFPGNSSEQTRLFREAYIHLTRLFFEICMLLGPLDRFARRSGKIKGFEIYREAIAQGRGVIFLSSHVGNWESMGAVGAIRGGADLMFVTKRIKPAWLHDAIQTGRARCGVKATYEPRTMKDILRHLKNGQAVGFVLDQYAGPPVGVRVPVFGQPVGTSSALATIARRTGAIVLPVMNYRQDDGTHVVEVKPALPWIEDPDPNYELAVNTAQYAKEVESHVRAHPEQWLWIHRRFKGDLSPLRKDEWRSGRVRT